MNKKLIFKFDKEFIVFITVVYYTSKLLWDNMIPYMFTLGYIALSGFFFMKYIQKLNKKKLLLCIYFVIFATYIIMNAYFKDNLSQLYRAVYEYIIYALPFFLLIYCMPYVNVERLSEKIVKWGLVLGILSWYEYFTKSYILNIHSDNTGILYGGSYAFRAAVFARSELAQGVILGFFTVIAFSLYMRMRKKKYLFYMFFLFASILTTSSRGPLVATLAAILTIYMLNIILVEHSSSKKIISTFGITLGCIAIMFVLLSDFQTNNEAVNYFLLRIRNILNWDSDAGNVGRISRWKWALMLYKSNPFWGIGPSKTGSWGIGSLGVTESGVLKRLCELGIFGFCMHYFFVSIILIKSVGAIAKMNRINKISVIMFIGILTIIIVNDFILQSTEEPSVCFIMWFSIAGLISYVFARREWIGE